MQISSYCKRYLSSCNSLNLYFPTASCIAAAREEREESPERVDVPFPNTEPKFLCHDCMRTKRPRLDRLLALLVSSLSYPQLISSVTSPMPPTSNDFPQCCLTTRRQRSLPYCMDTQSRIILGFCNSFTAIRISHLYRRLGV